MIHLGVFQLAPTPDGTTWPCFPCETVQLGDNHYSLTVPHNICSSRGVVTVGFMEPRGPHSFSLRALLPWRIDLSCFLHVYPLFLCMFCLYKKKRRSNTSTPPTGRATQRVKETLYPDDVLGRSLSSLPVLVFYRIFTFNCLWVLWMTRMRRIWHGHERLLPGWKGVANWPSQNLLGPDVSYLTGCFGHSMQTLAICRSEREGTKRGREEDIYSFLFSFFFGDGWTSFVGLEPLGLKWQSSSSQMPWTVSGHHPDS